MRGCSESDFGQATAADLVESWEAVHGEKVHMGMGVTVGTQERPLQARNSAVANDKGLVW